MIIRGITNLLIIYGLHVMKKKRKYFIIRDIILTVFFLQSIIASTERNYEYLSEGAAESIVTSLGYLRYWYGFNRCSLLMLILPFISSFIIRVINMVVLVSYSQYRIKDSDSETYF